MQPLKAINVFKLVTDMLCYKNSHKTGAEIQMKMQILLSTEPALIKHYTVNKHYSFRLQVIDQLWSEHTPVYLKGWRGIRLSRENNAVSS